MFLRYTIENDLTRKINVKVKEVDSFVYSDRTYELCGFTVHSGVTGNSGHYRAYRVSDEGGVSCYDDHGGATEPTLRKISPERLEKLKENGYLYLYKKKSRPSESCPEAVPSEPLASSCTDTVQSSMATDTTHSTEKTSSVDNVLTSMSDDLLTSNLQPIIRTPVKNLSRIGSQSSPSLRSMSPLPQSLQTPPTKTAQELHPSPSAGKRWLQRNPDLGKPVLEEVEELLTHEENSLNPVKVRGQNI